MRLQNLFEIARKQTVKTRFLAIADNLSGPIHQLNQQVGNIQGRLFNVLDDFNREGVPIEVGFSLPVERVIRALEEIIEWPVQTKAVRCDNGPEYISGALSVWALKRGIRLDYIRPGKPQ